MKQWGTKVREWIFMMWRPIVVFFAIGLIVGGVFGFRLGGLAKGASAPEQTYVSSVTSGKKLLENPLNIVHKLPTYILFKLNVNRIGAYRAISALFAISAVVSCFFILREWYSDRVAVMGTWLFLTSAWILHVGRLATPEASFLLMMPLLWAAVWLYNTTLRKSALLVLSFCAGLSMYIPGFGWLLILAVVWKHKLLWQELKEVPWWFRATCLGVVIVVLAPLLWAISGSVHVLLLTAGLPTQLPSIKEIGQNLINIPGHLFLYGPNDPVRWLGRLPLLDAFSGIMFIIGAYSLRFHLKLARIQLLIGVTILLIILVAAGGPVTITALIPLVYIFIAAGITFMLRQWFTVFPHNPVARILATTLMAMIVVLVSFYHVNHYFIAWPQTPATIRAFGRRISDIR